MQNWLRVLNQRQSQLHRDMSVERQSQIRLLFQNFGEGKSQENDTQVLLDSQENIFRNVSAVLSESSHSTNVGDLEETLLRAMDTEIDVEHLNVPSRYDLRTRPVKRSRYQFRRQTLSRCQKPSKMGKLQETTPFTLTTGEFHPLQHGDLEESQESVSMLQECYQENPKNDFPDLMETCMNSVLEVIDIYSDEETEVPVADELTMVKVESSTQTEFLASQFKLSQPKEKEMAKHAKFISSVVKLKAALSSKKTISDKKLWMILQGADDDESLPAMEIDEQTLPKETIGYILRSSDVENVFRETVQVLLQHLEDTVEEDFMRIACCWRNSVYETVVEMLSQAVDSEAGVWKMVASFLCRIIDSILKGKSKNWTSESKANFVTAFCQSTRLSYSVINCIIKNLKNLKTIQRPNDAADKLFSVYLTNNSCFLLQILECSLDFLKTKVSGEAIEGVLVKKPEGKNYNVLEMWKKHWNREEASEEQKPDHEWKTTVSGWCDVLDEILLHCVHHIPVLSAAVGRCEELAKDIFKLSHSGTVG